MKSRYAVNADGKKFGPYSLYFEDGKPQETGNYKDDQLDGPQQAFHPNGNVKLRREFRAGRLQGSLVELDERGNRLRMAEYRLGQLNGTYREFPAGSSVASIERLYVDGAMVYPRSQSLIAAALAKIRAVTVETRKPGPDDKPVPKHPGGNVSQPDRENAVRLLMEYRNLCYVPHEGLQLDPYYNAETEAAVAILDAIGKLSHSPENPGWPEEDYKIAKAGCGHSNLYGGGGGCVASIGAYMNDSDPGNITVLGHRRWCLNPAMGRVGIAASAYHSALWSFDGSRKEIPDWDFVACPAPGFFPVSHFNANFAWSVTLNETKYHKPSKDSLKVSIRPAAVLVSQGQIKPTGEPMKLNYFNVDLARFGIANCIVFRPEGLTMAPGGVYVVDIDGLMNKQDKPAKLRYVVEFWRL
ncbi:MAG: hypothetical protein ABSH20_08225 [Tepidisphaeraceae bacterium]